MHISLDSPLYLFMIKMKIYFTFTNSIDPDEMQHKVFYQVPLILTAFLHIA